MFLDYRQPDFEAGLAGFLRTAETSGDIRETVTRLIAEVRARGNEALLDHLRRFDGVDLDESRIHVGTADLRAAPQRLSPLHRRAIRDALRGVQTFHRRIRPRSWTGRNRHGALVGERYYPLRRVGLYIPGGSVPLVSTVIMTAGVARLAGVPEIVVCSPPRAHGDIHPTLLAALALCGVGEVCRLGGATAVAAMAFGTATIAPVVKIFGPGNAYVNEAKRQVFGHVGIDLLAGPSEVLILADQTAHPEWVAADLLAQAEHGSGREKIFLVCCDPAMPARVDRAIASLLPGLAHREAIAKVLQNGYLCILTPTLSEAAALADRLAPEHLELHVETSQLDRLLNQITTAGAIFLGHYTPTVLGDFAAGPNHTLPTGLSGRFASGLRTIDFLRRTSLTAYPGPASLAAAAPVVQAFSEMESLDAHALSLAIRQNP